MLASRFTAIQNFQAHDNLGSEPFRFHDSVVYFDSTSYHTKAPGNIPLIRFRPAIQQYSAARAMAMDTTERISDILLPSLLEYANQITFPWPVDQKLDASEVGRVFFDSTKEEDLLWTDKRVTSALLALSEIELSAFPSLLTYLPSPGSADFLHQATGLVLLLDQGSRHVCKGVNARYICHFFDLLCLRTIQELLDLPSNQSPFDASVWMESGFRFDQALIRIVMFHAPIVHAEDLETQDKQLSLALLLRAEIERQTETRDGNRAMLKHDLENIYGMFDLLAKKPPRGEQVHIQDFGYWMVRYFVLHVPYIHHFGRVPLRNVATGRDTTSEEKQWLAKAGIEEDEAVRRKIQDDIKRGIWTPLKIE